jgi:hypothetical protein
MIEGSGFGSIPLTNKSGSESKRPKKSESSGSGFGYGSTTLGQIVKKEEGQREDRGAAVYKLGRNSIQ